MSHVAVFPMLIPMPAPTTMPGVIGGWPEPIPSSVIGLVQARPEPIPSPETQIEALECFHEYVVKYAAVLEKQISTLKDGLAAG